MGRYTGSLSMAMAKPNWVIETTDGWVDYEFQTENRQRKETSIGCFDKAIWVISIFPSARKGRRRNLNSATFRQTKCSLYYLENLWGQGKSFMESLLDFSSSRSWRHNSPARKQFPLRSTWQRRLQYQLKTFAQWVMRVVLPELTQWNGAKFSCNLLRIYRVVQ